MDQPKVRKRWADFVSDEDISLSILRNRPPRKNLILAEESNSLKRAFTHNNGDDSCSGFVGRFRGASFDNSTPKVSNTNVVSGFDRVMLALEGKSQSETDREVNDKKRCDTFDGSDKENYEHNKRVKSQNRLELSVKSTGVTKASPTASSPVSELISPYIHSEKSADVCVCEWRRRDSTDHLHVDEVEEDRKIDPHTYTLAGHTYLNTHECVQRNTHTHTRTQPQNFDSRVSYRKKQIAVGKSSKSYQNYLRVKKTAHIEDKDPQTPNPYSNISNSLFAKVYSQWRQQLHQFDTLTEA